MAAFTFDIGNHGHIIIDLKGEIVNGDSDRLQLLAKDLRMKYGPSEGPVTIIVALDSPGGDYGEGLALGNLFWECGYATLVRKNAQCYSSAAIAFLGGAFRAATGGRGSDRTIEMGSMVGFHGFYMESSELAPLKDGIECGKYLSIFLADFAVAKRIDMAFILEGLKKGPGEFLILKTVDHFRKLDIKLLGTQRTYCLTQQGAVFAANYATQWKRPVSLLPKDGEARAEIFEMSAYEFRVEVLKALVARNNFLGPLKQTIDYALLVGQSAQIENIYRDLVNISAIPYVCVNDDPRVIRVTGFEFGGGFYVTDCYVIPANEATENFAITVVTLNTGCSFSAVHYSHSGDCLYEVLAPESSPVRKMN